MAVADRYTCYADLETHEVRRGAQIEITRDLREPAPRRFIASVIREAISDYVTLLFGAISRSRGGST